MFSSPLQRAIARGMEPDGDLADELMNLSDYRIRSRKDARTICEALRELPMESRPGTSFSSPLRALTGLFQDVDGPDAPAFDVLFQDGQRELMRIFDATIDHADDQQSDDLLLVLKIFALYGSREGAERVVQAAQRPLKPDAYIWHVILSAFSERHPEQNYIYESLSDPLPPDFIAVALLDRANSTAINGQLERHPFDSPSGLERLQSWLEDRDPEHFSYALSATAALPFVNRPYCDQLMPLAMDHVDASVQMEAAWAAGKMGREAGFKILSRFCLDINRSDVAQKYLTELGREELIPAEAKDPLFQAKAEFSRWLAHPSELGQPPDELEVIDHRELAWPPERQTQPFYLIRYCLRDRTGLEEDNVECGLVGSMTWCFFTYKMHERPPEDAYAIHCYWEMETAKLIAEAEVTDASEYATMLGQWQGTLLHEPTIVRVAELSPELKTPSRFVALASAKRDGEEGWVVLDGPRSTWYPKAEQPEDTHESAVLMIHVGRQLLGFQEQPDRAQYLIPATRPRKPEAIVAAYEKLMQEVPAAAPSRQKELLGSWSLLSRKMEDYLEALAEVEDRSRTEILTDVYERFLELAMAADRSVHDEVHDTLSVLGEHFDAYVSGLASSGRSAEIAEVVTLFASHWNNNLGYGRLGRASFSSGDLERAEEYFVKLQEGMKQSYRCEEMSLLAEIWNGRGESNQARQLLLNCIRKLAADIEESKYNSDRKTYAEELLHHRSTFLRLFPDGEGELAKLDIPRQVLES